MIRRNYVVGTELKHDGKVLLLKRKISVLDFFNPNVTELRELSHKTKIPLEYLKDSLDKKERPRVTKLKNFSHIIYKAPKGKKHPKVVSFSIIFDSNNIIILRQDEFFTFERFYNLHNAEKVELLEGGIEEVLFWFIDHINGDYFSLVEPLESEIDKIEKKTLKTPKESLVTEIFQLKKVLIYFHKAFSANRDVIMGLEHGSLKHIRKAERHQFRDAYYDLNQLSDMEATLREILTSNLEIYLGSVSNNMNEVMKKLTVYASFIMVPTLISGVYGMNFKFMPELSWIYGYPFAFAIMIISVLGLYFFFRRKNWI